MEFKTEHLAPCRVLINATLSVDEVGRERSKIVSEWARAARLDGFRKGKAPRHLVERRFEKEIDEDLAEALVRTAFDEARSEAGLRPAGPLEVRSSDLTDGGFTCAVELDVYPDLELAPLEGFTAPQPDIEPTEEEMDTALKQLRERQAAWEPVESEPAADGMMVEAEVHGSFPDGDGEPFHEERSLFVLGDGEVFPEIESAVRGAEVGAEVLAERTLGEEAGERKGTRIAYAVKIKSLRRKRLPDLDDNFAASLGVAAGMDGLRERVGERVRLEKSRQRYDAQREALIAHLGGGREFDLPTRLVDDETRREGSELAEGFARRGIDPSTQVDWEKLAPEIRRRVERRLRGELLLDALAENLGIVVRDAEVDAEVERQSRNLGVPYGELRGNLAKRGGLERIRAVLRRERAVDRVLGSAEDESSPRSSEKGA